MMTKLERRRRIRWIPLLLTLSYAIFAGVSFQFFHGLLLQSFPTIGRSTILLYTADGAYVILTVLLVFLLITRLLTMINDYEAAIESSEERFREVVESTQDWVWELNPNLNYSFVSPNIRGLLGYEPEATIGKTPFELMTKADVPRAQQLFQLSSDSHKGFRMIELNYSHQDGHQVIVESTGNPLYDDAGVFHGFRGIDRDVTERHHAEKALEKSYDYYRSLFDEFPLPIWRSGPDGRIIYYNRAGERFLGNPLMEATMRLGEISHNDAAAYEMSYTQAVNTREPFVLVYRLRRYDGEYALITHTGQPCYGPGGTYVGYIGYFQEATREPQWAMNDRHTSFN